MADFRETDPDEFCAQLGSAFYADPETMRESLRAGRAFNVLHTISVYKFDLFPAGDAFTLSALQRRSYFTSSVPGLVGVEFAVASAEDTLLANLSDRQWHDILGIVKVQAGRLDMGYLREWAQRLGVADLLERAGG